MQSIKTTLAYAKIQLLRNLRDPITTIVLFGIPVVLVLVFGSLTKGADNLSLKVAVINNSQSQFAQEFKKSLDNVKPFKQPDKSLTLDQARDEMNNDALDGIIELPAGFGDKRDNIPSGSVRVYFDQTDPQTGDIVASIIQNVVSQTNQTLVSNPTPLAIERTPIKVSQANSFDNIYAMFSSMALMMVGIFAVASVFPGDRKTGALRRLHVTPIRPREIIIGTMLCFSVIGLIGFALLTALSIGLFDFTMRGSWLNLSVFVLLALATMLGFGLAISSIAKNSTQSDILGQIIFIASLSVSGVWFPRALMPEFLQNITAFMPLTPVIEGVRNITTENAALTSLTPEIAILAGWAAITYFVGAKLFRWT